MGVILLAIWEVLVGTQMVLFGLGALSYSGTLLEGSAARTIVFFISIGSLVVGISALLLARGYVKGYESARRRGRSVAVFAILFAILGIIILPARLTPDSPFWTILMNTGIFWYLGSDKVVTYFRAHSRS